MELRHLRYFRAVGEELHFGRAADRLHIAQPPLSQQIRQLEHELGVKLLERNTRRVELTPAGAAYLRRVVTILDAVDDATCHARRIADGMEGRFAIGCVGSATYSLLPQLVRVLREDLPGVDVSIRGEMLAPAQLTALLSGEIDLALLRPPVPRPDLEVQTVRRDRLLVALPHGHALTSRRELRITDLRDEEFVAHAGSGRSVMNTVLTSLCADAGFVPRVRHEVEETSTLVTLVAAGLGVAVVPDPTASLGLAGVCYRPLVPAQLGIELVAAHAAQANSPLIKRVLAILRNVARHVSVPG
ncbi:LysR substrate-binding domain-containing protein [Mycobacterium sp. 1465703.0]|uniref:LysR substrate-binding domain-containing protein n=1 Tax=Mycobacterium sp. 1465703.0 TaxID=1834078 RepID=UPI0007FD8A10|nr:LysR substrate-binding domain-containing protein [Mycobacterium sp. 1465703.0]OBJ10556.1 LysR family transcriptional regulator [Mycobacterium sp. 1465703.0]